MKFYYKIKDIICHNLPFSFHSRRWTWRSWIMRSLVVWGRSGSSIKRLSSVGRMMSVGGNMVGWHWDISSWENFGNNCIFGGFEKVGFFKWNSWSKKLNTILKQFLTKLNHFDGILFSGRWLDISWSWQTPTRTRPETIAGMNDDWLLLLNKVIVLGPVLSGFVRRNSSTSSLYRPGSLASRPWIFL